MEERGADQRFEVVTLARRPDLLPVIADWLWNEWWRNKGCSLEETRAIYENLLSEVGVPQMMILLADDSPIGTASLVEHDLDERPNLTPWLAAVFVIPERRGCGHVHRLLEAFDEACRVALIGTAWLYTSTAERVYLRAGWHVAETIDRPGKRPVTLMRRDYPK